MMSYLLQGHIAVVTGAGSGIGQGIAVGYAVEGARVIAVDINEAGAVETVAMIDKAGATPCLTSWTLLMRQRAGRWPIRSHATLVKCRCW